MKFSDKPEPSTFSFYFDSKRELQKTKYNHDKVGSVELKALSPVKKRSFAASDFSVEDCTEINENVLESTGMFVGFMQSMIGDLIKNEKNIL
jgi:hypothetical protein